MQSGPPVFRRAAPSFASEASSLELRLRNDDREELVEQLGLGDVDVLDVRRAGGRRRDRGRRRGTREGVLLTRHVRAVAEVAERADRDAAERVRAARVQEARHQLVVERRLAPVRATGAAAVLVLDRNELRATDLLELEVRELAREAVVGRRRAKRAAEVPERADAEDVTHLVDDGLVEHALR